ncbi:MAG: SOS response-associated peptidase family protein, partial [Thermodesulfobacteriota bacterium]
EPNELVRPIHDRMPVILPSDAYALWLDRDVQDIERVRELLAPARAGELVATPVSSWVNDPQHDDPQCVAPAPPVPRQLGLRIGS